MASDFTVDVNYCYMDLSLFGATKPSVPTTTTTATTTTVSTLRPTQPTAKQVVSVSSHQGAVDWAKVKAAGIDYALLRCGYGEDLTDQDDSRWDANTAACEQNDIPYGAWFMCYARNAAEAAEEARHALRLLEGKNLTLPIFYEMTYSNWQGNLTPAQYATVAKTFCETLQAAGYTVGVQATRNWWDERLTDACFDGWYRLVMQYGDTCEYPKTYHVWLYSEIGTVNGISGNICRAVSYVNFKN